ncbi:MAG: polyhydroxyalkanoate synthesis regulator DNA-binding domain-containing protein [Candidatus Promineifilaceae bacterium]|jgi:polyhydroxyalkanoate synthesis repressor PhaR
MPVIKRYPNRKLYDTEAKSYITLEGIAELIRAGQEVTIIDYKSDEDLTAVTLTQIIFEQEKKQGGFLPTAVLTSLVRTGGDTLNSLRRGLSAPLDLVKQVDSEIERRMQILISKGELAREEGVRLRDKLLSYSGQMQAEDINERDLALLLSEQDVPTREELEHLNQQIQGLTKQLEILLQQAGVDGGTLDPASGDDTQAG